jgi:3-phosphoshikimate 1-carboxyvinyltransferase
LKRLPKYQGGAVKGEVLLPLSKSLWNRIQIIQALAGQTSMNVHSDSPRDVQILGHLLNSSEKYYDLELAGTSIRFGTAFLASRFNDSRDEIILSGSARMKQRPIAPLVESLQKLGADIGYGDEPGYPPIKIKPKRLKNDGVVYLPGDISSQFISSLLMIGPYIDGGLDLFVRPPLVSMPYVEMTADLMRQFGAKVEREGTYFRVAEGGYQSKSIQKERDWTAASYWFSLLSLSPGGEIYLRGLKEDSLQGDRVLCQLYEVFGIKSTFDREGLLISMDVPTHPEELKADLRDHPDLAQTIVVSCLGIGIPCFLTGLQNLRIKETDRLQALSDELEKFGAQVQLGSDSIRMLPPVKITEKVWLETYGDHRMAMAFAPLCMCVPIKVGDEEVVKKSYPNFWSELEKILVDDEEQLS